jgi:hypothetical protein
MEKKNGNKEENDKTTLSMKEGCLFVLFCTTEIHPTGGCFRLRSWSLWKALDKEGCIDLVSSRLDL